MVKWLVGFAGLMAIVALLFFVSVPAAKVDKAVNEPVGSALDGDHVVSWDADGKPVRMKSGLRIAVEGRLHWLGIR